MNRPPLHPAVWLVHIKDMKAYQDRWVCATPDKRLCMVESVRMEIELYADCYDVPKKNFVSVSDTEHDHHVSGS